MRRSAAAVAVPSDLADPDAIEALVATTRAELGRIDVVVNYAAASGAASWLELDVEAWDRVQRVNVRAPWLLARSAYPDLRASRHGVIINVTSVMTQTGQPGKLHYTASKAALIGVTRALAREVGHDGVRVNAVMPGAIGTEYEGEVSPTSMRCSSVWCRSRRCSVVVSPRTWPGCSSSLPATRARS